MRLFVVGASGVIGRRLVPRLVEGGHEVTGMTRTKSKADALRETGAEPVVCDVLDAERLRAAMVAARPEIVVQQLTDLPQSLNPRKLAKAYEANNRARGEGTPNVVAAARAAGARRIVAQSICFLYAPEGDAIKDEEARVHTDAPPPFDEATRTTRILESSVTDTEGIEGLVTRFGFWYGPGTSFAGDGYTAREVRRRRYPIVGDGGGIFSFIHVDDVADATIAALDHGEPGIYNVVDDEPAPVREWLPAYAEALGAKPPRRVPRWLARLAVGKFPSQMMTVMRGASNAKAKRELGWRPGYPSWRQGFAEALG